MVESVITLLYVVNFQGYRIRVVGSLVSPLTDPFVVAIVKNNNINDTYRVMIVESHSSYSIFPPHIFAFLNL